MPLILLMIGFFSSATLALDNKPLFPVLACPAIGDEYEQMIAKLDVIKTSINKDANCKNVELNVKSLGDLVTKDREAVLAIIDGAQGNPLTADQSKTVRDYAENVTKKVAALNDLFTQANYCFRDSQPQNQLSTLAGFVGEASQMVGALSGPWGAPIALAGNVIAGFLTGLDAIFKTRAGYDFRQRDQWISYVNNLCTYHRYRDQIQHLLNPQKRLNDLATLKARLDNQIDVMSRECEECRQIESGFEGQKSETPQVLQQFFGHVISAADSRYAKPYGTYMLQNLGLRDWVKQEAARIQRESNSYWADATGRHLLSQAKENLEQFLIDRSAPKFIRVGVEQALSDDQQFSTFIVQEGRPLTYQFNLNNKNLLGQRIGSWGWASAMDIFRALVVQPIDWNVMATSPARDDLQFQWEHFQQQSLDRFRNAQASAQVVQSFCAFFQHAGYYSASVRANCLDERFLPLVQSQDGLATELAKAGVQGAAEPLDESGEVYMTRLDALMKQIEVRGIGQ